MSWERGYYYHARKVNGHVVKTYVGKGLDRQMMVQLARLNRDHHELLAIAGRNERQRLQELDDLLDKLTNAAEALMRASLEAAGYHQHRGQWRKKRGSKK
jgi:stress response protein SCP2